MYTYYKSNQIKVIAWTISQKKKRNRHTPQSLRHQTPLEGGAEWLRKNIPQTNLNWKKCKILGLLSSSNLQVTISRVGVFVFKGRPKRNIRPINKDLSSCKPIIFSFLFFSFFFLNVLGRTVMCSLYIYTSQYLKENFSGALAREARAAEHNG